MFLKQIFAEKRSFEGKYASFKNIKFPRGNYQTDTKFSTVHQFKNYIEFFNFFRQKSWMPNVKFEKENKQKLF